MCLCMHHKVGGARAMRLARAHAQTRAMQRSVVVGQLVRFASSSAAAGTERLVLGCGSNVIDHIYRVRGAVPLYASSTKIQ